MNEKKDERASRIAVVVPAFREEERIGMTVRRVPSIVNHVIVVDDASDDRTSDEALAANDGRLRLVKHSVNRGVGAAILTGYAEARALGADVAVVMAGDGQMDPDDLPALIDPIVRGDADYVKGDRLRHPAVWRDMPLHRLVGTAALAWATRYASGLSALSDSQCGYTAIGARAMDCVLREGMWPRYGYPNDVLGTLSRHGYRIAEVPVRPVYQGEKSGLRAWHLFTIGYVVGRVAVRRVRKASAI
ncbi:MAG: glycosyltransferase family 2 protein [Polyangiaceae bacterium]|nr:glycosyltransferase family 2 protein [Polyangiaceae bacterium]